MSSRDEHDKAPKRKLRVPAALAVAFVGSSAMVSIWYGGCHPNTPDPSPDAGRIESHSDDALPVDAGADASDVMADAGAPDVPIDAPPAQPPPDADEPPH